MSWGRSVSFYHLFPLGCLGAPRANPGTGEAVPRLANLEPWLDHVAALGLGGLLLGPVCESATHGYDILDLRRVDRRLGSDADLARLVASAHARGIKVMLDGVFNHVGRGHWAFQDVLAKGRESRFAAWFVLDFDRPGPRGESFHYETWRGHDILVTLDTRNPETREYLLATAEGWIDAYGIDGIRLDAADVLALDFQAELAARCHAKRSDFWLLAEAIHGDYRRWTGAGNDSVTNYILHKALWSAFNDGNMFELAHTLDRQFGPKGTLCGLPLATFLDNHDTRRIASKLRHAAHLAPLQALLFALPGVPFVYYGSEAGIVGEPHPAEHDWPLRPELQPGDLAALPHPELVQLTATLAQARAAHPALREGDYRALHVAPRTFAFLRRAGESLALVAVNAGMEPMRLKLRHEALGSRTLEDALGGARVSAHENGVEVALDPASAMILL